MSTTLPALDSLAKAHSQRLQAHLITQIDQRGPLSFETFMRNALYAPGLGYYSAGSRKFGQAGDFVTAPELSPLFSHCIAKQVQEVLEALGGGDVLELGAGTGVMALEILRYLKIQKALPDHYFILEVSADLRERQQQLFDAADSALASRVVWLDALPEAPITGVVLGNEVVDAMPVHKFQWENGVKEFCVDWNGEQFLWCLQTASDAFSERVNALGVTFEAGYTSEINTLIPAWMQSLFGCVQQGAVLLIDYGFPRAEYYHHDRSQGTLMCHFQHRAHDNPLINVGVQDITAHVDFTALAEAAHDSGFTVAGYTHQAAFLLGCGLTDLIKEVDDEVERYQANQQIKRLTLPSEMGELFKVIAFTKNMDLPLCGFSLMNQLERL